MWGAPHALDLPHVSRRFLGLFYCIFKMLPLGRETAIEHVRAAMQKQFFGRRPLLHSGAVMLAFSHLDRERSMKIQ
ncbi:MAG: hypothetical protein CL602_17045 [Alteromonas sp.]|nr:hypothetical protein [Alteromonas sp.]MBU35579.1 hypothetical protein [Alteromonas sp.]